MNAPITIPTLRHYPQKLILAGLLILPLQGIAEEAITTFEATITASQEQPTLLVIIPWQKPQAPEHIDDNILNAKENFFLQPLERRAFRRYSGHLQHLINDSVQPLSSNPP